MKLIQEIPLDNIEEVLKKLGYFDLEFNYYGEETKTIWYEGYIDTDYRIQIIIIDDRTLEIWDCDYYIDNFVRAGIAKKIDGNNWEVIEG